ncbi:hypothetical protein AVEN_251073-1 [Araneus ventricosus]|uniref:Uncharacterized protein n=1 Tax=Araneus ventricosus TaxID=182803 RepID=A0A4Y2QT14_ARAVE|nr:hypothetical protein AVEN_251073-1 [Araneus ventricosus]
MRVLLAREERERGGQRDRGLRRGGSTPKQRKATCFFPPNTTDLRGGRTLEGQSVSRCLHLSERASNCALRPWNTKKRNKKFMFDKQVCRVIPRER